MSPGPSELRQALSATVGSNTAAIQQVSQAQTSTDGQLSAMWAVKMQVTAGGQYVAPPSSPSPRRARVSTAWSTALPRAMPASA
ncbi:phage tail tip fiber protein [Pseudomonas aeruginosa]